MKVDLALRAVAEAEQLTCSDEELDEEIAKVAEQVKQKPARVRGQFERGGQLAAVRSDVRKRKAFDWLLESVEIVDESGQVIERADLDITPPTEATAPAGEGDNDHETEADTP